MSNILDFYKKTSIYTNYGPYKDYYLTLPNNILELGKLIESQTIHRVDIYKNNKLKSKKYSQYPWYRYRCEDDILLTATSMMAELFRLDDRGLILDRNIDKRIVVTCRYVAVLMASILKAKGISARCRSGFEVIEGRYDDLVAGDHWIIEFYNTNAQKWISYDINTNISPKHNYLANNYEYAGQVWLDVRSGKKDVNYYRHGTKTKGMAMLARSLFYDFHALMNDEISYLFLPTFLSTDEKYNQLTEDDLKELDNLATLLLDPDKNFNELKLLFDTNKKFRAINTPLLEDSEHTELEGD